MAEERAGGAGAGQPYEVLERAAARLENLAADTSPAPWFYEGGAIRQPGTDRDTVAPYAEWQDQMGNAHWICAMSPPVAAPLVALLRATAQYARALAVLRGPVEEDMHVEHALTFARMVLGEAG